MIMHFRDIKFKMDKDVVDKLYLSEFFKKIDSLLNVRFDENLNPYIFNNTNNYEIKDVSHLNQNEIEHEINTFFDYSFTEIIDVSLYRFLVLKNNNKITILAIIHSSIFDYTSIKKFNNLFDNPNNIYPEKNLLQYSQLNDYMSSSDFENDLQYWRQSLLNLENYVKFYNIKLNNYENIKMPLENEKLNDFLKEHKISKFNFITAVFSLYLSRINRTQGCLLNTFIPQNNAFDKNTILKIDYNKKISFDDYLVEVENSYRTSCEHTKADIENYIDDKVSYYSIYDFTYLNDVNILNGEGSALTLNIFDDSLELIYNGDLFEEIYIKHMLMNILSLINNVLDDSKQLCCDISVLCDAENSLMADFSKSAKIEVNDNKSLGLAVHENALVNPQGIAIDDGVKQLTYRQLDQITNSIAYDLLNKHNVNRYNTVGLMISRSYHFPVLVIALNKIGVTVVPIDPDFPAKRIMDMIELSDIQNIIISDEYDGLYDFDVNVISVGDLDLNSDVDVDIVSSGDDLFAIMFTSGTTGRPKGVKFANKQISGTSVAYNEVFNITNEDIIGCYASFSFVASYRMYYALYLGATVRIFSDDERKDNLLLINALKENPLSQVSLPPSVGIPIFDNEDLNIKHMIWL